MELLEAVRNRPRMYLGETNSRGFSNLLQNLLTDIIFDLETDFIAITFSEKAKCFILFENVKKQLDFDWVENKNSKGTWEPLELAVLKCVSETFRVVFFNPSNEVVSELKFVKGVLTQGANESQFEYSKFKIEFELDEEIWGKFKWNFNFILHQIKEFAYLNKAVCFELNYKVGNEHCRFRYHFENGLKDKIDIEILSGMGDCYFETYINDEINDISLEVAFGFRNYSVDEAYLKSYVNNIYTRENGTHVDGLLKGLTYGVMKYFQKHELTNDYKISEKGMREHLVAAINVKINKPTFSGCVKNKLANSEIIEPIADLVSNVFFEKIEKYEETTQKLIRKFEI